jgi:hypothetical protein
MTRSRHAVARVSHRARPGHSRSTRANAAQGRRRGEQLCREHAGARIGAGDEPDDPKAR